MLCFGRQQLVQVFLSFFVIGISIPVHSQRLHVQNRVLLNSPQKTLQTNTSYSHLLSLSTSPFSPLSACWENAPTSEGLHSSLSRRGVQRWTVLTGLLADALAPSCLLQGRGPSRVGQAHDGRMGFVKSRIKLQWKLRTKRVNEIYGNSGNARVRVYTAKLSLGCCSWAYGPDSLWSNKIAEDLPAKTHVLQQPGNWQ